MQNSPHPIFKTTLPKSRSKQHRGGSKTGKSGSTWNKTPDEIIHKYVKECLNCQKVADQKIAYTKRIIEIPVQIKVSLQEHHMYQYEYKCSATTQAGNPTLEDTSLGVKLLSFLSTARKRMGDSFENLTLMIDDLSGKKISQTTLNRGLSAVNQLLMLEIDQIAQELMNSAYINSDETGHKQVLEGKRSQRGSKKIWVFVTPSAA